MGNLTWLNSAGDLVPSVRDTLFRLVKDRLLRLRGDLFLSLVGEIFASEINVVISQGPQHAQWRQQQKRVMDAFQVYIPSVRHDWF